MFNRRYSIDNNCNTVVIISKGTEHPACPKCPNKYRVSDYFSYMVIRAYSQIDKPGLEFGLTYFDNPGVSMPSALTTWAAMRAMPDFLSQLRKAAKLYKPYCVRTGKSPLYDIQQERERQTDNNITVNIIKDTDIGSVKRGPDDSTPKMSKTTIDMSSPGLDVMTSPSPTVQAEPERHGYFKYLHPYYYFSWSNYIVVDVLSNI